MGLWSQTRSAVTGNNRHRATAENIRRAFTDYHDELMWLALFLTSDKQLAETCVIDACTLATTHNNVFRDWLASWARRATIRAAIEWNRLRIAELASIYKQQPCSHRKHLALSAEKRELLVVESDVLADQLDVLCRFALIMRGVEKYSAADSALMLGISRTSLEAAYCTALQSIESFSQEPVLTSVGNYYACTS